MIYMKNQDMGLINYYRAAHIKFKTEIKNTTHGINRYRAIQI